MSKAKSTCEFLPTLIHELRNPLAPLTIALKLIEEYYNRKTPPQFIKQQFEIIKRQASFIENSMNEASDLISAEKGLLKIEVSKVELCSLIEKILQDIEPIANLRKVFISHTLPNKEVWIQGEKKRLKQSFSALMINVLRMTESGDTLSITVNPSSSQVMINISAFKPCKPNLEKQPIFKNTEIGFLLAQQIIALHGGIVEQATNNIELGAEITIVLPLFEITKKRSVVEESVKKIHKKTFHKIMVVDDFPDTAESLSTLLKFMGHHVEKCQHSGSTVVQEAKILKPDIVMVDIGMPGLDGYSIAQELRKDLPDTKLMAITGYGEESDKKKVKRFGFHKHLIKPVDINLLEDALCEIACVND